MSAKTCRDCGYMLEQDARGCPSCAMNIEAENMIERIIWRRFVPGAIIFFLGAALLVYLLR